MTHSDPKPAASGPKRRLRECVEVWPNCYEGGYDPRCCRFPKSCSCDVYDWERVGEDDLEPAPKAAASDDLFTDDDLEEGVQWISARHPRFLPEYRKRVWEQAYRDGESSREADYTAAFEEWPQMLYRDDVTAFAKRVRAEVLRQAADEWESPDGVGGPIATWLRARADAEETTP